MTVIELDKKHLIGHGTVRYCFQHPHDKRFVIKVAANNGKEEQQANIKEFKGYQYLKRRHSGQQLDSVSHCHGFVDTDHGSGLVCDCIRDADGTIAKTIWDLVVYQEECDVDQIVAVVSRFCEMLEERRIWLFDLNLKNIALAREFDNSLRPVAIDLKGRYDNCEFIPLSSYFGFFARKKLERRCRQLIGRIPLDRARRYEYQKGL